ncbi:hypothetical protein [Actinoplanes sp. NPDC026670]|uniref:hypothetical protein n=1 Tax=Actinoplanes sp. NPDC026670 TaxID=3154700 RepID=UPI0033E2E1FE
MSAEQRARVIAAAMGFPETSPVSPAATDDPVAQAEVLIDKAIALSRQGRREASAEMLNGVIATLTRLRDESATAPGGLDRTLFRAAWRLAVVLQMGTDAVAALRAGRQALELGRALLAGDADEQVIAGVVVMAADVAEIFFATGLTDAGLDLLMEAEQWSGDGTEPALLRARSTVLHNWTAAGLRMLAAPEAPEPTRQSLENLAATATEAVGLRRRLRDPSDGVSLYELANSLRLLAQIRIALGDNAPGADSVAEAYGQVESLSPGQAVNQLKSQLDAMVRILERIAPADVAQQRAMGRIPG